MEEVEARGGCGARGARFLENFKAMGFPWTTRPFSAMIAARHWSIVPNSIKPYDPFKETSVNGPYFEKMSRISSAFALLRFKFPTKSLLFGSPKSAREEAEGSAENVET